MEYFLSEELDAEVPEGTSLLFHGSALSGKREASFGTLARVFEDGEAALVVCFESRPEDAVAALVDRSGLTKSEIRQHVGILNASAETTSLDGFDVEGVDSPASEYASQISSLTSKRTTKGYGYSMTPCQLP
jgi:hypothetical protein